MTHIKTLSATSAAELRPAAATDLAAVERLLIANGLPLDGVPAALTDFVVAQVSKR